MFTAARIGVMDAASRLGQGGMRLLGSGIRGVGRAFRIALGPMNLLMTALFFGVDYVIEHWDTIGPYFTRLWEGVKTVFDNALKWMQPVFDNVGKAFEQLGEAWDYLFGDEEKKVSVDTVAEKAGEQPLMQPVGQQAAVQPAGMPVAASGEKPFMEPVKPLVGPVQPVQAATQTAVQPVVQQAAAEPTQPEQSAFLSRLHGKTEPLPDNMDSVDGTGPAVSVSFDFAINGAPDRQFAQGVINAIRDRRSDLEQIISALVHDQMRLTYGS